MVYIDFSSFNSQTERTDRVRVEAKWDNIDRGVEPFKNRISLVALARSLATRYAAASM